MTQNKVHILKNDETLWLITFKKPVEQMTVQVLYDEVDDKVVSASSSVAVFKGWSKERVIGFASRKGWELHSIGCCSLKAGEALPIPTEGPCSET